MEKSIKLLQDKVNDITLRLIKYIKIRHMLMWKELNAEKREYKKAIKYLEEYIEIHKNDEK